MMLIINFLKIVFNSLENSSSKQCFTSKAFCREIQSVSFSILESLYISCKGAVSGRKLIIVSAFPLSLTSFLKYQMETILKFDLYILGVS